MPDSFDPYHKWLGISPKDQPPNHYRLLGIELFEGDPDVIEAAADQRMAHVRTYQTGQNSDLSQKILNELSAAKLCLLSSEKKTAYDAQLPQRRTASAPVSKPTKQDAVAPVALEAAPAISIRTEQPRRTSRGPMPAIVAALAAAVFLAAVGLWYTNTATVTQQGDGAPHNERTSTDRAVALRSDANAAQSLDQPPTGAIAPKSDDDDEREAEAATQEDVAAPTLETPPAASGTPQPLPDTASGNRADEDDDRAQDATSAKSSDVPSIEQPQPQEQPTDGAANKDQISPRSDASDSSSVVADRELPAFRPRGNWLDALKAIDPLEHLVQGDWARGRKDLQAIAETAAAIIEVPVEAEGSYDFQTQFTRLQGEGPLAIVFPVAAERGQVWLGTADGQVRVALAGGGDSGDGKDGMPFVLSNNHRYTLELRVRVLDNDFAAVEVLIDKKKLVTWQGSPSKLQIDPQPPLPAGIRFGLLCGPATSAAVHAVRVRAVSADTAPESRVSLKPKGAVVKLRIAAKIDGRDRCRIDAAEARWTHETWGWPAKVKFCGSEWSPQSQSLMPLEPRLKNALAKVDFRTAQLAKISGRGEIRLERSDDSLVVVFDDDAAGFGADDYEAVVTLVREK